MSEFMGTLIDILAKACGWLLGRPTLRVRIREDDAGQEVGGLQFEVENLRDKATSLDSTIAATYVSIHRVPRSIIFDVREGDRNLPPFTPKQCSASAREAQSDRAHGWFRTYIFKPTRGRTCRVRLRNAMLEPIGFWGFWVEALWFRATGRVGGKTSMTTAEYRARERSKGPH